MKRILFIFTFLLSMLFCSAQESRIVVDSVKSEVLQRTKKFNIYLPRDYDSSGREYPVLYLLHGLSDNYTAWEQKGRLKSIADEIIYTNGNAEEMIIVMPDAGTDYDGYFNVEGWNYEEHFFQEFLPEVEKRYRIKSGKANRAIAGLSMGGGGATGYALHHPELFSSAYAMSALMGGEYDVNKKPQSRFDVLLKSAAENCNIRFVKSADAQKREEIASVRWFIDVGDDDFLFDCNMEFIREMRNKRIPYELRVRNGKHDWKYWQEALYIALPWIFKK